MSKQKNISSEEAILAKRGRIKFTLIALLFILPMMGAWVLFFGVQSGQLWGTSNKGQLISPAIPLAEFQLRLQDGTQFTLKEMEIKWTLVYFSDTVCEESCQKTIYHLRQVRTALSKDMTRVERVLVLEVEANNELQQFLTAYPDMKVVNPSAESASFRAQFSPLVQESLVQSIFLVDPLGNIMMRYSVDQEPEHILKDLRKLLRISRIG